MGDPSCMIELETKNPAGEFGIRQGSSQVRGSTQETAINSLAGSSGREGATRASPVGLESGIVPQPRLYPGAARSGRETAEPGNRSPNL